jgi:hypothetical protein
VLNVTPTGWRVQRVGPVRDAVQLNAVAAIAAHDGFAEPPPAGALRDAVHDAPVAAARSIDSGAAADTPRQWVQHWTQNRPSHSDIPI